MHNVIIPSSLLYITTVHYVITVGANSGVLISICKGYICFAVPCAKYESGGLFKCFIILSTRIQKWYKKGKIDDEKKEIEINCSQRLDHNRDGANAMDLMTFMSTFENVTI